jgi:2Fe-2S ferredoxin
MPKIFFRTRDDVLRPTLAPSGVTVLQVGVNHNVPGLSRRCEAPTGCLACHVVIESGGEELALPSSIEAALLRTLAEAGDNSRLSCRLIVCEEMDGLIVRVGKI